jgi:hypothetical protein
MNTPSDTEFQAIALYSETGETWFVSDASETKRPLTWEKNDRVTKIVIGKPPIDEEKSPISVSMPENLAELYKNLTHLHLWQIENLTELPKLPEKLEWLDLRGCSGLTKLPTLPALITDLDFGGCESLGELPSPTPALQRLYLNDCLSLPNDELTAFWRDLRKLSPPPKLIEFDASRCQAIASLKGVPKTVEKLVLQGCEHLEQVTGLEDFSRLRHLNLADCVRLKSISGLPERPTERGPSLPFRGLQYVQLTNCENLTHFMNQTIGPYDRGTDEQPNVAEKLYSRRKFGDKLAVSAHAKLLLLGDGRVGKTTLSKRLMWDSLTESQRNSGNYEHLRPRKKEDFTHKIRFTRWHTPLKLSETAAKETNSRAEAAGIEAACRADGTIDGTVRIWDFGGQEIYHQTHRIFAAEGSVFLLVWKASPPDLKSLAGEIPVDVLPEEWNEWNRSRPLDYWIDYVYSIRPDAKIALVCTEVPRGSDTYPSWTNRASAISSIRDGVSKWVGNPMKLGSMGKSTHASLQR